MTLKNKANSPLLLFCISILFSACLGQPTPEVKVGTPVFKLEKRIPVIFQDSQNNYWFGGGEKGVYRYDGKSLVLFSKEDGLVSDGVIGIQEDKLGSVYFDTSEGVSKFDGKSFTTLEVKPGDPAGNEWKRTSDDLWFRMGWDQPGPHRYDGNTLHPLIFPKTEEEDAFNAQYPNVSFNPYGIYSIYTDSKGAVWFGTSSLGLCRFDGKTVSWLYERSLTETPEGGAFGIRSIIEDHAGDFWFCNTQERFRILPGSTERAGSFYLNYQKEAGVGYSNEKGELEFPYFMSMVKDDTGNIWMVTYDRGVWRSDGEKLIHYPVKNGDNNVLLFSIYKDKQGTIWVGTHNSGAYKYNGIVFEQFKL